MTPRSFHVEDEHALESTIRDAGRLAAVRATGLLDTPPEATFDRMTRLAARVLGAPVSFLSLVDGSRDFYKSQFGFGEPLASMRQLQGRSFCHYALTSEGPLVLDDVSSHPTFATVPTVNSLGIRAYAGVPLVDSEGHCVGSFCAVDFKPRHWTGMDVEVLAELAQAAMREIELRQALLRAEAAGRAKSAFLSSMSHEIRTPMNAILGFAHVLARSSLTTQQRQQLSRISMAGEQLMSMLSDLLDLSRAEGGPLVLDSQEFVPNELMDEVLQIVAGPARDKGLTITTDLESLPARLRGDRARLRQALLNFLVNAVRFTPRGTVTLRARVLREDGARLLLRFEVQDIDAGLTSEPGRNGFESSVQVDDGGAPERPDGALNLAIIRRIAGLMGGECGVTGRPDAAGHFWFTAWLETGRVVAAGAAAAPSHPAAAALQRHAGSRVLVVEDNPINQEVAQALLTEAGLEVHLADDGAQAVEMAPRGYRLVLMDMQMPVMDGVTATRVLRTLPGCAGLPIIAMTANAFDDDRRLCREAGMDDFIAKPLDPDQLYATVLKWLGQPAAVPDKLAAMP